MGLEKSEKSCGDGGGSAEHTAHKEREIPSRQKRRGEEHSWKLLSLSGEIRLLESVRGKRITT